MLNKAILMGRLTRDPELRYTSAQVPVAQFTLAVDRDYKKDEERETDFIPVTTWRRTAEFVSRNFHKGQLVAVTGRIQMRNYEDKEGNKKTATNVAAEEVFFAEHKRNNEGDAQVTEDGFMSVETAEELPF